MKSLYDEDGNILLQDLLIRSKVRKTAAEEYFAKNHTSRSMTGGRSGRSGKGACCIQGFFQALYCAALFALLWDRALQPPRRRIESHDDAIGNGVLMRVLGTDFRRERGDFERIGAAPTKSAPTPVGRELRDPRGPVPCPSLRAMFRDSRA